MARWFFAVVVAMVALSSARAAEPDVKLGMYQTMFRDVTPEMVAVIAKPLKSIMEKTVGLTGDAELVPDATTLASKLDEKKVHIGVFHGYEFAWQKQAYPNLEPLMVAVPNSGKLEAVVVVNKSNKATKISELADQKVCIPKLTKAHCVLFLEDQRKGSAATVAVPSEKGQSVDTILDNVAEGNADAALIDSGALAAYIKNSPGNGSVLKVIATSETFPFAVLAIRKEGLDAASKAKIIASLGNAHTTAYGQPLMMLWGLKNFEDVPTDYNDQLTSILKCYPAPKTKLNGTLTGLEKK